MKKVLLILLLFCFNVKAETYYSSYSDFSEWTSNEVQTDELTNVEVEERYRFYHEDIVGKYFIEGMNEGQYQSIDKEKFYYTDFSQYNLNVPEKHLNRIIESKDIYTYKNELKVRYIKIDNIKGGYDNLRITEISIRDLQNNNIGFSYECNGCNDRFQRYIVNGIMNENCSHISNGGSILIDLENEYFYDSLKFILTIYDTSYESKTFNISFYSKDNVLIMDKKINDNYRSSSLNDYRLYDFTSLNLDIQNLYEDIEFKTDNMPLEHTLITNKETYYRFKDLYYYYYKINKIYSEYMLSPTAYFNKFSDALTFYRYQKRDYIKLVDKIIIDSKHFSWSDYYESSKDVIVDSNIDLSINGIYKVKFITDFNEIEKEVEVNILDNEYLIKYNELKEEYETYLANSIDINLYNALENIYADLELKYQKCLEDIKTLENSIDSKDELILEYERLKEEYETDINNLRSTIDELNAKYDLVKKEYDALIKENINQIKESEKLKEKYDKLLISYNDSKSKTDELNKDIKSITKTHSELLKKYESLDTKYNNLQDKYNNMYSLNKEKEKLIKEQEKELKEKEKLEESYIKLNKTYEDLRKDYNDIYNRNVKNYNSMIKEINEYKIKINELNTKVIDYEDAIDKIESSKYERVKELENEIYNLKNVKSSNTFPLLNISDNYLKIVPIISFVVIIIVVYLLIKHKKN